MLIRFVKPWAGRQPGAVEDEPDRVLCANWLAKGVVELVEEKTKDAASEEPPAVTEDRAMPSPPRGRRRRRS